MKKSEGPLRHSAFICYYELLNFKADVDNYLKSSSCKDEAASAILAVCQD